MSAKGQGGKGQPNRRGQGRGNNKPSPAKPAELTEAINTAKSGEVAKDAETAAKGAGVEHNRSAHADTEPEGQSTKDAMLHAYREYLTAVDTYKSVQAKLAERETEVDEAQNQLEQQRAELTTLADELEPQRSEILRQQDDLSARATALDQRETDLAKRETEFAAGRMASAFEIYVAPLEQRRAELFATFAEDVANAQTEVRATFERLLTDNANQRAEFEETLRARLAELDAQRIDLDAKRTELESERSRLKRLEESLNTQREELASDAQAEAEESRRLLDIERDVFNETVRERQRDLERLQRKSLLIEEWERELGDVEGVRQQLSSLRADNQQLRDDLNRRATLTDTVDVQLLQRERDGLAERIDQLTSENNRLELERSGLRAELFDAQSAYDTRDNMEVTIQSYREQLAQLRSDLKNMSNTKQSETPFRECSKMDQDQSLEQYATLVADESLNLRDFIDQMQYSLYHLNGKDALSYHKNDLRIFVAGLAMSRLHILEGVSGTGKTTLPIAFARHIGGGSANVAVQAGWRDRQDLLGYFNEFQGHFRESDFLRGVYKAMTPAHTDGVFFVVLDEMNLSKVEQYFADYLKTLEDIEGADRDSDSVPLMDRSDVPKPKNLVYGRSGGIALPLPPNVWFVGTANQDETTQSFAPKTQSRAHIMQLPHKKPTDAQMAEQVGSQRRKGFGGETVPVSMLRDAFQTAQDDPELQEQVEKAINAFTGINDAIEDIDASLSLAPRFLDRQLKEFVPVLLATGGSLQLAVDHLVCTKVIRRMNERYNIQKAQRDDFNRRLEEIWGDNRLGTYSATGATVMLNVHSDR